MFLPRTAANIQDDTAMPRAQVTELLVIEQQSQPLRHVVDNNPY